MVKCLVWERERERERERVCKLYRSVHDIFNFANLLILLINVSRLVQQTFLKFSRTRVLAKYYYLVFNLKYWDIFSRELTKYSHSSVYIPVNIFCSLFLFWAFCWYPADLMFALMLITLCIFTTTNSLTRALLNSCCRLSNQFKLLTVESSVDILNQFQRAAICWISVVLCT